MSGRRMVPYTACILRPQRCSPPLPMAALLLILALQAKFGVPLNTKGLGCSSALAEVGSLGVAIGLGSGCQRVPNRGHGHRKATIFIASGRGGVRTSWQWADCSRTWTCGCWRIVSVGCSRTWTCGCRRIVALHSSSTYTTSSHRCSNTPPGADARPTNKDSSTKKAD